MLNCDVYTLCQQVKLVSIDAVDIADGNSSIILGLIWNIILFFQVIAFFLSWSFFIKILPHFSKKRMLVQNGVFFISFALPFSRRERKVFSSILESGLD